MLVSRSFFKYIETNFVEGAMKLLYDNRVPALRISICLFFLVGILLSFPLWTSDRLFPLSPVSHIIPYSSPFMSTLIAAGLIIAFILGIIFRNRLCLGAILCVLIFLFLQDQMRWQPWAYLYFFMLIPFVFNLNNEGILNYCRILLIGFYLWGGIHKLNPDFIDSIFTGMLTDLFGIKQNTTLQVASLGYIIPITEIVLSVMLIFPKSRKAGIIGVLLTHLFILFYLIKIDYNSVVYPWNIAMIIFVIILFHGTADRLKILPNNNRKSILMNCVGCIFFGLMPMFSLFNLWDNYLSFRLYSGKTDLFYIAIAEDEIHHIEVELHEYFWETKGISGGKMLNIGKWAMAELNVPFYPETRVFEQVAKPFCELGIDENKLMFVQFDRSFAEGEYRSFKCTDIQ